MSNKHLIIIGFILAATHVTGVKAQSPSSPEAAEAAQQMVLNTKKNAGLWDKIKNLFPYTDALPFDKLKLSAKPTIEVISQDVIGKTTDAMVNNDAINDLDPNTPKAMSAVENTANNIQSTMDAMTSPNYKPTKIDPMAPQEVGNISKQIQRCPKITFACNPIGTSDSTVVARWKKGTLESFSIECALPDSGDAEKSSFIVYGHCMVNGGRITFSPISRTTLDSGKTIVKPRIVERLFKRFLAYDGKTYSNFCIPCMPN
jgi:hypothetical protein